MQPFIITTVPSVGARSCAFVHFRLHTAAAFVSMHLNGPAASLMASNSSSNVHTCACLNAEQLLMAMLAVKFECPILVVLYLATCAFEHPWLLFPLDL